MSLCPQTHQIAKLTALRCSYMFLDTLYRYCILFITIILYDWKLLLCVHIVVVCVRTQLLCVPSGSKEALYYHNHHEMTVVFNNKNITYSLSVMFCVGSCRCCFYPCRRRTALVFGAFILIGAGFVVDGGIDD